MLIGDRGQSGGRRWEVVGFGLGPFSTSPKARRWVLHFCPRGIFGPLGSVARWRFLPSGHFSPVPRSDAWRCPDSPIWDFRTVPRSDAWRCTDLPSGAFSYRPKVYRWDTLILPQGHFAGSPLVRRWVVSFASRAFFTSHRVRRWVRHSPDSGFCRRSSLGSDAGCCVLGNPHFATGHHH